MKKSFFAHKRGGVMIMFAAILPVLGIFTAIAVDLYLVRHHQALLQKSVDAFTLHLARRVENGEQSYSKTEVEAQYRQYLSSVMKISNADVKVVTYNPGDGKVDFSTEFKFPMFFSNIISVPDFNLKAQATAEFGTTLSYRVPTHFIFLLDISTSMTGAPVRNVRNAALDFIKAIKEATDEASQDDGGFKTKVTVLPFWQYKSSPNSDYFVIGADITKKDQYDSTVNFVNNLDVRSNYQYPPYRYDYNFDDFNAGSFYCSNHALQLARKIYKKQLNDLNAVVFYLTDWDNYCRDGDQNVNSNCPDIVGDGARLVSIYYGFARRLGSQNNPSQWFTNRFGRCSSPGYAFSVAIGAGAGQVDADAGIISEFLHASLASGGKLRLSN